MGLIDIAGQRFGKLVALEYVGKERWRTICDCGNEYIVYGQSLRKGLTTHCGCSKSKRLGKPKRDLTGQKYGRLTFVSYAGKSKWVVKCDCGTIKTIQSYDVLKGLVVSCGCYHHEIMKGRVPVNRTHGLAHTPIFNIWAMMKNRCTNPNCNRHQYYKDKGIKVCDRWLGENGFENFVHDMGERPSPEHSLDRIDNNGDYCPENCRWATYKEQSNNQTSNVILEHNGEKKTLAQWCDFYDFDYKLAHARLRRGFAFEEIFYKGKFPNRGRKTIKIQAT